MGVGVCVWATSGILRQTRVRVRPKAISGTLLLEQEFALRKATVDKGLEMRIFSYTDRQLIDRKNVYTLNTFHSGLVICLADLPNIPYRYAFRQLSSEVRTFTGHLWKISKAQKFAPPASEARVSARVGLELVADQTSACRFAYTLPSCNPQCFKYS